jgi:hypothetical protein
MGQSLNDGVTARCIEVRVGGVHAIWRAETVCVAPPHGHPLIDTPCSAVVPCPEEVKISCDSTGSAFAARAQSCLAGLEGTLNPYGSGPFFCCQEFAPCSLSCCALLQPR